MFLEKEINILDHELVPKHTLLSQQEKEEIIKKYGIKKISQVPKILKSDPVVQLLKANSGDLIRIARKSDMAKESIYYRVVVEG
jgi:DNA-directed RNA polymerase subunit H